MRLAGSFLLAASLLSCAWVKPTPSAKDVRVASAVEVAGCKAAGSTQVSVLDKVAGVRRGYTKVSEELETLARNSAAQLGGNTVVPTSEIVDGTQTFDVYQCKR
jgi:hypothetical protein